MIPLQSLQRSGCIVRILASVIFLLHSSIAFAGSAAPSAPLSCTVQSSITAALSSPPSSRLPTILFWDVEGVNFEMFGVWFGSSAYQRCPVQCEIKRASGRGSEGRAEDRSALLPHADAVIFWATPLNKGLNPRTDKCEGQLWMQASTEAFDINILNRTPPTGANSRREGADLSALMDDGVSPPALSPIDMEISWRRGLGSAKVSWLNNMDWNFDYSRLLNHTRSRLRQMILTPTTKMKEGRDEGQASVAAFISNCGAQSPRLQLLRELQEHIPVDSFGQCMHNKDPSPNWTASELDLSRGFLTQKNSILHHRYKFLLSFENQETDDYVTEKFFHPLQVGVLPIVLGASNIDEYSPAITEAEVSGTESASPPAFINVRDFASMEDLASLLRRLDADDDAYLRYFEWRLQSRYPALFESAVNFSWRDSPCQVCQAVHQKLFGYQPVSIHKSNWDRSVRRGQQQEQDEHDEL